MQRLKKEDINNMITDVTSGNLTVAQAAERYAMSIQTVYYHIKKHKRSTKPADISKGSEPKVESKPVDTNYLDINELTDINYWNRASAQYKMLLSTLFAKSATNPSAELDRLINNTLNALKISTQTITILEED